MTLVQPSRDSRRRLRTPLLVLGALVWMVGITALHQSQSGRRTTKGAAELLQIGALPVT